MISQFQLRVCKTSMVGKLLHNILNRCQNVAFSTISISFLFFKNISTSQVRTNKLVNKVVYHPCPSRLASGIYSYFFKLLRVLSLSRMLTELSLNYIFTMYGKSFSIYGVQIRKCIESMYFFSCTSSSLKTPGTNF